MEQTKGTSWLIAAPKEMFSDIHSELSVAGVFLGDYISDRGMFPPDAHLTVEAKRDMLYITLKGNGVILESVGTPLNNPGDHIIACRTFMLYFIGRALRP
jgi:hypothetical protein